MLGVFHNRMYGIEKKKIQSRKALTISIMARTVRVIVETQVVQVENKMYFKT